MMKLSARNQLKGTVVAIEKGAVNGVVKIEIAPGMVVTSSITNAAWPSARRHTPSSRPPR